MTYNGSTGLNLSTCYQRQSAKLPKTKTNKFIKRVVVNFLKSSEEHFVKIFFCNLTSRSFIIFCRLLRKSLGVVLSSRDGW